MKVAKESRLFYAPKLKAELGEFLLDVDESHHLIKVLRSNLGDVLNITNGKGLLMTGEITDANKKKTIITLKSILEEKKQESQVTIAISPTKSIERFEWFLEKATEIGVERVIPFVCTNSERKTIKKERLEKIVVSAMKQSGRLWKPELDDLTSFDELIKSIDCEHKFIAHCFDEEKIKPKAQKGSITILIGPEGGFTLSELNMASKANFVGVTLGDYRLRSETAGIVACQLLNES